MECWVNGQHIACTNSHGETVQFSGKVCWSCLLIDGHDRPQTLGPVLDNVLLGQRTPSRRRRKTLPTELTLSVHWMFSCYCVNIFVYIHCTGVYWYISIHPLSSVYHKQHVTKNRLSFPSIFVQPSPWHQHVMGPEGIGCYSTVTKGNSSFGKWSF